MIRHYDKKLSMSLIGDNLYCMVFGTLKALCPDFTRLNPVEIWMAAKELTEKLVECPAPEELMDMFVEELEEDCSKVSSSKVSSSKVSGGANNGNLEHLHSGTFTIIVIVSICQLSARRKKVADAAELIKLLLPLCNKHEMFDTLMQSFSKKEQSMLLLNKKVDILTYEFMQMEGDNESMRQAFTTFFETASTLSPESITSNLLAFNLFNLQNGHILDDLILKMYDALLAKAAPGSHFEIIAGNKNVAHEGSTQLNADLPKDANLAGMLGAINQLKQLK